MDDKYQIAKAKFISRCSHNVLDFSPSTRRQARERRAAATLRIAKVIIIGDAGVGTDFFIYTIIILLLLYLVLLY